MTDETRYVLRKAVNQVPNSAMDFNPSPQGVTPSPRRNKSAAYVAKKSKIGEDGKVRTRYAYKAGKGWEPTPYKEDSFIIHNAKTGSEIHVSSIVTDSSTKVNGVLRNKDGEPMASVNKEINSGKGMFYEYRRWNPNRERILDAVVEELKLHDRPSMNESVREMERTMQDKGMALTPPDKHFRLVMMTKAEAEVGSIRDMRNYLMYASPTDQTRRQLVTRIHEVFDNLSDSDKLKAVGYVMDIVKYEHP